MPQMSLVPTEKAVLPMEVFNGALKVPHQVLKETILRSAKTSWNSSVKRERKWWTKRNTKDSHLLSWRPQTKISEWWVEMIWCTFYRTPLIRLLITEVTSKWRNVSRLHKSTWRILARSLKIMRSLECQREQIMTWNCGKKTSHFLSLRTCTWTAKIKLLQRRKDEY